jgi:hypothetical protein
MTQLPAPQAVIQLVKCGCSKTKCDTARCSCRKAELFCSDICSCSDIDDSCENVERDIPESDESDADFDDAGEIDGFP